MGSLEFVGKTLCSKPVAFAVGVGIGLAGLYAYARTVEQKKLDQSQKELDEAVEALRAYEAAEKAKEETEA